MFSYGDYLESVEGALAVWTAAVIGLLLLTGRLARQRSVRALRLVRGQRGVSYTLSVVLVTPFYVLLIGAVIECTLLMVVKLGTMHAAFAAARSAIVWLPAEVTNEQRLRMIHLAAAQGVTPFASGVDDHQEGLVDAWTARAADHRQYAEAMNGVSLVPFPAGYLEKKRRYALAATEVHIEVDEWRIPRRVRSPDRRVVIDFVGDRPRPGPIEARANVTVRVTYHKPIDLPAVGRFLGQRSPWGAAVFTRTVSTTVTLQKEGPKSHDQTLGIRYHSWDY